MFGALGQFDLGSLRQLFEGLVWQHFYEDIGLEEAAVARYVSQLLADFTRTDRLYRITDAHGAPIEGIAELLVASNPLLGADSFDRERAVRKHVGDYTLFMAGLFPEAIPGPGKRNRNTADALLDFMQVGKEAYGIVAAFDQFEYRSEANLFRQLSESFELCVAGLHFVRHDLDEGLVAR
jgi:hypothetical protein